MSNLVRDLFETSVSHLWKAVHAHEPTCGFSIPEYQREYSWDESKVKRLLESCISGFSHLAKPKQKRPVTTFLGTLILIRVQHLEREPGFADGNSLSVVDGQQRLITLLLLCCALVEELSAHKKDVEKLGDNAEKGWIKEECEHQINSLYKCTNGALVSTRTELVPYPKIVREGLDFRGIGGDAEYESPIASLLSSFANFYKADESQWDYVPKAKKDENQHEILCDIYRYIKTGIHTLLYEGNKTYEGSSTENELSWEIVHEDAFKHAGLKDLFHKQYPDNVLTSVSKNPETAGLIRLILFSSYMINHVVLTKVVASDEDSAFDIFDSLNTTGEPLTALETLKPHVVKFENLHGQYSGSESETSFRSIEKSLHKTTNSEERQKETKELLTSFALYYDGHKLPYDLNNQRTYIRNQYNGKELSTKSKEESLELKQRFVASIDDLQEFRDFFWHPKEINKLAVGTEPLEAQDMLRLCSLFISKINTSIAIPALARYWKQCEAKEFISAAKIITSFIVLRRAATGQTANIDGDFRELMAKKPKIGGDPLCLGRGFKNSLISIEELKQELRGYLAKQKVFDKDTWIKQAQRKHLAKHSRPLCRFLIFAAAHNSRPDLENPGLLKSAIPSDELSYLNPNMWQHSRYATVEHVAPISYSSGWDKKIYERDSIHTLGNLVLLPQAENSRIGKSGWDKKKMFYGVLVAQDESTRAQRLENAEKEEFKFTAKTKSLLKAQERLALLDPIYEVDRWDLNTVENRTENLLALAWRNIAPELGYLP